MELYNLVKMELDEFYDSNVDLEKASDENYGYFIVNFNFDSQKYLKENKKELENILKDLNNAKKDLTDTANFTKQIQGMINKDIDNLSSKVALPGLDTKNISRIPSLNDSKTLSCFSLK